MLDLSFSFSADTFSPKQPLSGEISPSLLQLQNLDYLDLSFNNFNGLKIPNFLGSFAELKHLKLSGVGFVGVIPNQLGNLSNLQTLDLSRNSDLTIETLDWFSGFSSLKYLNLSQINLSEIITWPQSINKLSSLLELQLSSCNLPDIDPNYSLPPKNTQNSLQVLELSYNRFVSPSVFFWLSNLSTKFVQIGLSGCEIHGQIPDVFAKMSSLVSLDLSYNKLEGGFPKSFRSLCRLESLNVLENRLSNRLYDSMKNLSCSEETLKHLSLSGNPFSGPFPDISRFSSLIELFLDVTNITGPLPKNLTQFSNLVSLSLAFNKLTGPLPDFAGLLSLRQLFFPGNRFNGSVPESLGQLSSLEYLDFSSNSLSGVITESHFSNLSRLRYLAISQNRFLSLNLSTNWVPNFQLSSLDMSSCRVGPIFPKWLQTQRNLSSLYVSDAEISDSIPDEFWNLLTNLRTLNLSSNKIHGNFPNLSATNYSYFSIDLSSNSFDGPIPILPSLSDLFLSGNKLSGSLSSLCDSRSPSLSHLDLSDNELSGEIPDCWDRFPILFFLNLAKNNFTGKIPNSLSSLENIMLLRLNENGLAGEMPSLENCTELRVVDLGSNKLSGSVPKSFSGTNLPKLLVLRLRRNELNEALPSSLCSLPSLHVIDFSHNKISGSLPSCLNNITSLSFDVTDNIILGFIQVVWKGIEREFGANLKHLRSIDVSSNFISGEIPKNMTSLLKLVSLNLSENDLVGNIPRDFDKLSSLESLDLSRNRISGEIPASFAGLNFLSYLDLSYNNLRGKIPIGTQIQTFSASSFVGNLELCGPPLTESCPGDETVQDSDDNESDNSEKDDNGNEFVSSGFYVSIGIGFFVGFWGVCGSFLLKTYRR